MNEPIDPERIKELIWDYRTIAGSLRSQPGDPRNMGLDEHVNSGLAGVYELVANDLEGLLK